MVAIVSDMVFDALPENEEERRNGCFSDTIC